MLDRFTHSEEWKLPGTGFLVTVKRWARQAIPGVTPPGEGMNVWNVYAYIYPRHSLFSEIAEGYPSTHCVANFPMHKGANYLKAWADGSTGAITSYQVGCDYNYIADDWLTHISDPQAAEQVFSDALRLFDWLNERAK